MLQEIPFYLVIFAPYIFAFFAIMGIMKFIGQVTAKPKPPAHVDTPEEMAASKARVMAMVAQAEKSRLAHHH
jgi:hypothetical protein